MPPVSDFCCFAELETRFRRHAARVPGLGAVVERAEPCKELDRIAGFNFGRLLRDYRPVWLLLDDCAAGPWQVPSEPSRVDDDAEWDALTELPCAAEALNGAHDSLAITDVAALTADEQALHRCMVDTVDALTARLSQARSLAVPDSWRLRFCFMALTSLRFPDTHHHMAEARHGFAQATAAALTVLAQSGDPAFAAAATFDDPGSPLHGTDRSEFDRVVQELRTDPLLSGPDRVLALPRNPSAFYLGWVSDLLWWCGVVEHGDWLVAAVPAVCAAASKYCVDLGVAAPMLPADPAVLDLALTVADAVPADGSVEPLRFAEGVLAPDTGSAASSQS